MENLIFCAVTSTLNLNFSCEHCLRLSWWQRSNAPQAKFLSTLCWMALSSDYSLSSDLFISITLFITTTTLVILFTTSLAYTTFDPRNKFIFEPMESILPWSLGFRWKAVINYSWLLERECCWRILHQTTSCTFNLFSTSVLLL